MTNSRTPGRHFLQIPGPTPVPDRILRAIDQPVLDHRGPKFQKLGQRVLAGIKPLFKTKSHVIIFPSSGTGAWEASLVNTLSQGDKVLMYETGHFSLLWRTMAERLGLVVDYIPGDWRAGIDAGVVEARLVEDKAHAIKAVCVVHNETSTGVTSNIVAVRRAIDAVRHPALLLVDAVSSLGSIDLRHDEWGIDVTVAGSQKGLMLPPGLSFTAVSQKALAAAQQSKYPKNYWSWEDMLASNATGYFPYTPATNILFGLAESIEMFHEEGLENVFARHDRLAEATRRAVRAWGLEIVCRDSQCYSPALTAVFLPEGHDADQFRKIVLDKFDMSLGTGLTKLAGKAFRIGHIGDTNDLTIIAALSGVEMGLELAGVPYKKGGASAAMDYLADMAKAPMRRAAE